MGRFGRGLPVLVHILESEEEDDAMIVVVLVRWEEVKVRGRGGTNATAAGVEDDAK